MPLDVRFEVPSRAKATGATGMAASRVAVQARRPMQVVYGYGGQPFLVMGRYQGMLSIEVEIPFAGLSRGDAVHDAVEGLRGNGEFTTVVGEVLKVTGCNASSSVCETVSASPGANVRLLWRLPIEAGEPYGILTTNEWVATGNYILPSMPDLAGLSAEVSTDLPMVSVPVLNIGAKPSSGMPATQFRISGTLYNNARMPADLIPVIENSPMDPAAAQGLFPMNAGNPLMEVSVGWAGSRRLFRNAVNTEAQFEFSSDQSGMSIKASRTFTVVPKLSNDWTGE